MAEKDDIRLRQTVQKKASPGIRDKSRPAKSIDFGGLAKQASQVVADRDKAQAKADEIFERDFRNKQRGHMYQSWAKVSRAEKMDVEPTRAEQNKFLNDQFEKDTFGMDEAKRQRLRVLVSQDRLPYEKFGILHASKETESHVDAVNKRALELETSAAVLSIDPSLNGFEQSLKGVNKQARIISDNAGFDQTQQKIDGVQAEGNAVLSAMKSSKEVNDHKTMKSLFDRFQNRFVTADQKIKAEAMLASSNKAEQITEAIRLKNEARAIYGDDFSSIQRHIETNARDGEIAKSSLEFMRHDRSQSDREIKRDKDKRTAQAVNMILDKGPAALQAALTIAPADEQERIRKTAKNWAEGALTISEPDTFNSLIDLMNDDEQMFASVPLEKYLGNALSDKDYRSLKGKQDKISNKIQGRKESIQFSTVKDVMPIINRIAQARGFDRSIDPKSYSTFVSVAIDLHEDILNSKAVDQVTDKKQIHRMFEDRLRAETFITNDDEQIISKQDVIEGIRTGTSAVDVGIFTDNINDEDFDRVADRFAQKKGRRPTPKEMQAIFDNLVKKKLGLENFKK